MLTVAQYRYVTWFILAALVVMSLTVLYTARAVQASDTATSTPISRAN